MASVAAATVSAKGARMDWREEGARDAPGLGISQDCERAPSPKNTSRRGSLARGTLPRGNFGKVVGRPSVTSFFNFYQWNSIWSSKLFDSIC